jgi:hypothetical protein
VERNDSGVGSDSGLSVSYPKLTGGGGTTTEKQAKDDGAATCRECDSAVSMASRQSPEQANDGGSESCGVDGSLCTKCAKKKGERKEIIRYAN